MPMPKTNWEDVRKKAGYASESDMWDDWYCHKELGTKRIRDKLWKKHKIMISQVTIWSRLKELDYQIKPRGGGNNPKHPDSIRAFLEDNRDKWADMTLKQICDRYRLVYTTVQGYLLKAGIKFKKGKRGPKKRS